MSGPVRGTVPDTPVSQTLGNASQMPRLEGLPERKQHEANRSMTRNIQTEEVKWSGHLQSFAVSA